MKKVKINFREIWDDVWVSGTLIVLGNYFTSLIK